MTEIGWIDRIAEYGLDCKARGVKPMPLRLHQTDWGHFMAEVEWHIGVSFNHWRDFNDGKVVFYGVEVSYPNVHRKWTV